MSSKGKLQTGAIDEELKQAGVIVGDGGAKDLSAYSESDRQILVRDGSRIRIRVFRPTESPGSGSPLIVLIHGGSFCVGSLESETPRCRSFVQAFGAVCVSVGYRLAPEHPFPTAPNDCWDALRWVAANATALGATPSRGFIVGGTSAGANLATVLAHLARDERLSPPLTGQYLCVPSVLPPTVVPQKWKAQYLSYEQHKNAPILPRTALEMFANSYKPNDVCDVDPLRDEALIYETVLRTEWEVKTKLDVYPGLPHGFWFMFPTHSRAEKFRKDLIKGTEFLLGL
ncbi:hypothetical protein OIDMADRAFT_46618 [Oidiodendron maius Zn]|uniref:Alpha/beta hydrolase fold-3 domain-containing protein n=1 Tax=Oidiodendron maius (strain Zn) TaxID=913774 RepID=A0A0C3CSK0_OIDMZ|nr:hypothetical protein OIDMADRAFT_46618 [Oidiodendron maius Zn]